MGGCQLQAVPALPRRWHSQPVRGVRQAARISYWDGYRERYGDLQRLDRILEAEGKDPNDYKVSKQADVLMIFYLFSSDEIGHMFDRLGYKFTPDMILHNIQYYICGAPRMARP